MKLPRKIVFFGVSGSGKSTLGNFLAVHHGYELSAFAAPLKRAVKTIFGFDDETLYGPASLRDNQLREFEFSGWCFECHGQCRGPERLLGSYPGSSAVGPDWVLREEQKVALALLKGEMKNNYWLCMKCGASYPFYVSCREALKTLGTAWGRRFCNDIWITSCLVGMAPDKSYAITDGRFWNEREASNASGCATILLRRGLVDSVSPHPSEKEVRDMACDSHKNFTAILDNDVGDVEENCQKLLALLQSFAWEEV